MERKLAAIFAADVAGYSALMEEDEERTHAAFLICRGVAEAIIIQHGGRVFGGAGDSIMAEFGSPVEALRAAIEFQQDLARRTLDLPKARTMRFRIGVNLGDVMIDHDDVFGDDVNIANRLQALAEPGGISITRNVYDQVKHKAGFRFEALGDHHVKNIAEPLTVYRVLTESSAARSSILKRLASVRGQRLTAAAFAILLLCGAGGALWYLLPRESTLSGRLAIAVLPLENMGGDEAMLRLSDGIAEDIITDLARFADLDVIARNSTLVYKGKPVNAREVGREFGVAYVVTGSIQRRADKIRITSQLVDARTGLQLWSERWDRPVEDTFDVQTEVAERVAGTLGSISGSDSISAEEIRSGKGRSPASLTAYDYYLLAGEGKARATKESIFAGIDHATRAIALDPTFARAYAMRARLHFGTIPYGADYEIAMRRMGADVRRAVELDPQDPGTRAALAWYLANIGRPYEAEIEIRAAVESNPVNVHVLIVAAAVLARSGRPEEAAKLADKVLRIDPRASPGALNLIKDAYFFAHRFEDVVAVISRIPQNTRSQTSWLLLASSYALLDRQDESERARAELLAKYPSFSAELLLNRGWVFGRPEEENLFFEGIRAAGVSLCATDTDLANIAKPRRLPECMAQAMSN